MTDREGAIELVEAAGHLRLALQLLGVSPDHMDMIRVELPRNDYIRIMGQVTLLLGPNPPGPHPHIKEFQLAGITFVNKWPEGIGW